MADYRFCFVEHERACTRLRGRKLFWDPVWFNDLVWLEALLDIRSLWARYHTITLLLN